MQWVESRDSSKFCIMCKTTFTTKIYLVQNVNSAAVEKS